VERFGVRRDGGAGHGFLIRAASARANNKARKKSCRDEWLHTPLVKTIDVPAKR